MQEQISSDREFEWLDHVQPVGLVLARSLLKSLSLNPERQTKADEDAVTELLSDKEKAPALSKPWSLFERVLGWNARNVAGAPGGEPLPPELNIRLPEYNTDLAPTWAVRGVKGEADWQLLVRIEKAGIEPDKRGVLDGWEATPHQRFERLLRETRVHAGVLLTDNELRLIYAPRGETSGWIPFPLRPLGTVAGRPMLGGLKLVLGSFRLFNDTKERRLPALLRDSREAQATVSTNLSAQVLGALHELLRGLYAAEPKLIGELSEKNSQHLYEGLLSVLMRLVFVLYAEDRDLLPSKTDGRSRAFYQQGYSVRGLFAKLLEDEARYPDTMNERVGGWGRLIALFRLVHGGHKSGWIKGRGGKLFDPKEFLFLEGRAKLDDAPRILTVSDGTLLRILRGLMVVDGERLSYRTLDVEQIGSVYETVMGFTVEQSSGPSLAIKAGKNNKVPIFVNLEALLPLKSADRIKRIKEETGRKLSGQAETKVKQAKSVAELAAAIDGIIDERGSPMRQAAAKGTPILQPTDERRRTGSHYTPRSLTEPIVRHALEPALERIGLDAKPEEVLSLKICDPAMGSGAFLVEACRMLAARLVRAWARWPELKPSLPPDEDDELHAKRLIAQRCLYGVDKNPMATDLAKLSLWLATLARDHEFEFVDHALKTGDSLVGLSNAQIAAANWDESMPGLPLFQKLVRERMKEALAARTEIREAPDDVQRFIQEVRHQNLEKRLDPLRSMGDATVAAFFSEVRPRSREQARQKVESLFTASLHPDWAGIAKVAATLHYGDHPVRPFHWQIEFPEVFEAKNPGFDAIVGNPPFLGGSQISVAFGNLYSTWLLEKFFPAHGKSDLVAFFFRQAFALLKHEDGAIGFLTTKTIRQGHTRATSLEQIISQGGRIYRAIRRRAWPGDAAVVVAQIHIKKGDVDHATLDGRAVNEITSFLLPFGPNARPSLLAENVGVVYSGVNPNGKGFVLSDEQRNSLIEESDECERYILPYLGSEDLNGTQNAQASRWIICVGEFGSEQLNSIKPLYEHLWSTVRVERQKNAEPRLRDQWWKYSRPAERLYARLPSFERVLAMGRHATYHTFAFQNTNVIFSDAVSVFLLPEYRHFAILQSSTHENWAYFLGSSIKDDPRYIPEDCFETFPFPKLDEYGAILDEAGYALYEFRHQVMTSRRCGLTEVYNMLNDRNQLSPDIVRLRELHDAMDRAVITAYGWTDLAERIASDPEAMPRHLAEDTEDDHKYQGRYFWPASVRDEVLARLLALNAERAEAERLAGLTPVASEDLGDDTDENNESEDEAA